MGRVNAASAAVTDARAFSGGYRAVWRDGAGCPWTCWAYTLSAVFAVKVWR